MEKKLSSNEKESLKRFILKKGIGFFQFPDDKTLKCFGFLYEGQRFSEKRLNEALNQN